MSAGLASMHLMMAKTDKPGSKLRYLWTVVENIWIKISKTTTPDVDLILYCLLYAQSSSAPQYMLSLK